MIPQRISFLFRRAVGLAVLACLAAAWHSTAWSQDRDDKSKELPVFREQTIYVPYGKLRETFEKPGRGVFLPYEEFQRLWETARAAERPVADQKAPVPVVVTEADNEATVEKDVVRVRARIKISVLKAGWHEAPLRLNDAAIISATLDGRPATILTAPSGEHTLLVHSESERPIELRAELEYARAFTKTEGRNHVAFAAPRTAVNRWKVRIPQPGVEVEVKPLVAVAAEAPPGGAAATETVVLAFVGSAPQVEIQWTPKAEGASGLAAVVTAQVEQEVSLESGAMRTRMRLALDISRAELAKIALDIPAGHKVVNVFDANVRKWSIVSAEGGKQRVNVDLFEPRRGIQPLSIELERFTEEKLAEVEAPVVRVVDAGRQQGTVVVRISQDLRAEATRTSGLSQVDAAELPAGLAKQKWDFAYRYAAVPFELALRIEKVQPQIHVSELVEAYLEPDQFTLDHFAVLDVRQAGVFQLQLEVPPGFDVRTVTGRQAPEAAPAAVESHHLTGDKNSRLVINLSRRAQGKVGLFVELVRRLDDPNLSSPTGKNSTMPLVIPRVTPEGAEDVRGRIVVYAPESLRVNTDKIAGATSTSADESFGVVPSTRDNRFATARPVAALAYSKQPVSLNLVAERRRPQITVAQLLVVRAKPGVVSHEATFKFDIKYSGVKSLRIDIPSALAGQIRNVTPGVREQTIDPAPKDLAEGYVAWNLVGQTEFFGPAQIKLTWEKKLDKLEVGKSVTLEVPRLVPRDVDIAMGQVVLVKEESIDVVPTGEPRGLRPIDPQQELIESVPGAASAFEFHDDWALSVAATRYQPEEIKWSSIEHGVVRTVCTRTGTTTPQALYRMRSASQRLKVVLPKEAKFDTDPVRINGRTAALELGQSGEHYIPLAGQSPDAPFILELRYQAPGTPNELSLPEFPDQPAVQKIVHCVYLPREWALVGMRGPWTPLADMWLYNQPIRKEVSDRALVAEVLQGANVVGNPAESFPTDGRMHAYSTLGQSSGSAGALRLVTIDETLLNAALFGATIVVGLVALRRPARDKIGLFGASIVALILVGVFLPTFTEELLDGYFPIAVVVVLVMWGAWHLALAIGMLGGPCKLAMALTTPAPADAPVVSAESPAPPPEQTPGESRDEQGGASNG